MRGRTTRRSAFAVHQQQPARGRGCKRGRPGPARVSGSQKTENGRGSRRSGRSSGGRRRGGHHPVSSRRRAVAGHRPVFARLLVADGRVLRRLSRPVRRPGAGGGRTPGRAAAAHLRHRHVGGLLFVAVAASTAPVTGRTASALRRGRVVGHRVHVADEPVVRTGVHVQRDAVGNVPQPDRLARVLTAIAVVTRRPERWSTNLNKNVYFCFHLYDCLLKYIYILFRLIECTPVFTTRVCARVCMCVVYVLSFYYVFMHTITCDMCYYFICSPGDLLQKKNDHFILF